MWNSFLLISWTSARKPVWWKGRLVGHRHSGLWATLRLLSIQSLRSGRFVKNRKNYWYFRWLIKWLSPRTKKYQKILSNLFKQCWPKIQEIVSPQTNSYASISSLNIANSKLAKKFANDFFEEVFSIYFLFQ